MTAIALSQLPLQAGSALAAGVGRAVQWGVSRYARAPLANTSVIALVVFTTMAGSNALYLQAGAHPAPLFGPAPDHDPGLPQAVTPATRTSEVTVPPIVVIDQTGSIQQQQAPAPRVTAPAPEPIGNAAVIDLQRKLSTLGFYDGKVDGVFGPKTSGAIRRFEERAGLPPKGELTPAILDAVARAPLARPTAAVAPAQTVTPLQPTQQPIIIVHQPAVVATNEVTGSIAPAAAVPNPAAPEDSFQPLPDPAPLQLSLQQATQPQPIIRPGRDLPDSPREVLDLAVATARNGIEALASVIENGPQLGPLNQSSAQVVQAPAQQIPVVQVPPAPIAGQVVQQAALQQPMPPVPAATAAYAPPTVVANVAPAAPVSTPVQSQPMTDRELVAKVQRGLTSLGFMRGEIDGVAGEATAKAIRNFEVYYNYDVTGRVTPGLVDLLVSAGAQI